MVTLFIFLQSLFIGDISTLDLSGVKNGFTFTVEKESVFFTASTQNNFIQKSNPINTIGIGYFLENTSGSKFGLSINYDGFLNFFPGITHYSEVKENFWIAWSLRPHTHYMLQADFSLLIKIK
jgi:hypothetical protein